MPEQVIGVWLIEDGNNVPSYVRRCVDHLPSIVWTMSPFNAYRFPSKEIAQVFMDWNVCPFLRQLSTKLTGCSVKS